MTQTQIPQVNVHDCVAAIDNMTMILSTDNVFDCMCDDDKVVRTDGRRFFLSAQFFGLNVKYNLPYMSHHVLPLSLSFNAGTIPTQLAKYSKDIHTRNKYEGAKTLQQVAKDLLKTNNRIHNVMTAIAKGSQTSMSIIDLLEVVHHPIIVDIFNKVGRGDISVKNAYAATTRFFADVTDLPDNNVIRAVRSKMVNENQVMQCLMVRGFPTEVNGDIMPIPVMTNFTKGFRKVYDYVAESRSAAKSYYFTDEPLKKSEYFARRLQLVTMTVERIHYNTDCGSQQYVRWPCIRGPEKDVDGNVTYPGDLNFMEGIYYLDEPTNTLRAIQGNETHLYGQPLLMRNPIACKHHDAAGVCEVCFGELAKNIPPTSNIGHTSSCVMTQQTTQSTMGTKHLDASSVAVMIVLEELARVYFRDPDKHQTLKLKSFFKDKSMTMTLDKDQVRGITDLQYIDNIDGLNHAHVTAVINVGMTHTENGRVIQNMVRVAQTSRRAYLSKNFLRFVKAHGYKLDSRGNFVFDLQHWNFNQEVFQYTKREQNYSQHGQEISVMIESSVSNLTEREKPDSPQQTLYELFNLVNSKLSVHLSCLSVIIYAMMIPEKGNYGLARGAKAPILGVYNQIMANRSLSAMYVYRDLRKTVMAPESFIKGNRPDHPMDVCFDPQKVVEHIATVSDENRRYVHPTVNWPKA